MGRRGFDWSCGRVLQGTCETSPAPPFDFASGQVFQRRGAGLTPFPSRLGTAEMPAPSLTSIASQACLRYARFYLSAPASKPCPERSRKVAGYCQWSLRDLCDSSRGTSPPCLSKNRRDKEQGTPLISGGMRWAGPAPRPSLPFSGSAALLARSLTRLKYAGFRMTPIKELSSQASAFRSSVTLAAPLPVWGRPPQTVEPGEDEKENGCCMGLRLPTFAKSKSAKVGHPPSQALVHRLRKKLARSPGGEAPRLGRR